MCCSSAFIGSVCGSGHVLEHFALSELKHLCNFCNGEKKWSKTQTGGGSDERSTVLFDPSPNRINCFDPVGLEEERSLG